MYITRMLILSHTFLQHDNPRIQVVLNDGTRQYQHHTDGKNTESGGCVKDFRNRPYPVKMRVVYLRGVLEVCDNVNFFGGG